MKRASLKIAALTRALNSKNGHILTKNKVTEKRLARKLIIFNVLSTKIKFGIFFFIRPKNSCHSQKSRLKFSHYRVDIEVIDECISLFVCQLKSSLTKPFGQSD